MTITEFLDKTGLQYLITKIESLFASKSYVDNAVAQSGNPVVSVTAPSGEVTVQKKDGSTNSFYAAPNILQRNTQYNVGDVVTAFNAPSWATFECIQAGTTAATEPDFSGIESGAGSINAPYYTPDEQDIQQLQQDVSQLQTTVAGLQVTDGGLQQSISSAQSQINAVQGNVNSLGNTVSQNSGNISSLQTSVSGIQSNVSALQTAVNQNTSNISSIQTAVESVQSGLQAANQNIASVQDSVSSVESSISDLENFAIIYPNGGSASNPASITTDSLYTETNPFPGYYVICIAQVKYNGIWGEAGWYYTNGGSSGVYAGQILPDDVIKVQAGTNYVLSRGKYAGNAMASGADVSSCPCRVLVRKIGQIQN